MNTKEKVLQKCAELKETEHNEVKIFVRGLRNLGGVSLERYGLVAKWIDVTVDPSYPPDHSVWPLAAQVLGIQLETPKPN